MKSLKYDVLKVKRLLWCTIKRNFSLWQCRNCDCIIFYWLCRYYKVATFRLWGFCNWNWLKLRTLFGSYAKCNSLAKPSNIYGYIQEEVVQPLHCKYCIILSSLSSFDYTTIHHMIYLTATFCMMVVLLSIHSVKLIIGISYED